MPGPLRPDDLLKPTSLTAPAVDLVQLRKLPDIVKRTRDVFHRVRAGVIDHVLGKHCEADADAPGWLRA